MAGCSQRGCQKILTGSALLGGVLMRLFGCIDLTYWSVNGVLGMTRNRDYPRCDAITAKNKPCKHPAVWKKPQGRYDWNGETLRPEGYEYRCGIHAYERDRSWERIR